MHSRWSIIVLLMGAVIGLVVWGCGGDNPTAPGPPPGPQWPGPIGALPAADQAIFDSVVQQLTALRAAHGIAVARDSLLARLAAGGAVGAGLAGAHLGNDGTTITLRFSDGADAVILTDEETFGRKAAAREEAASTRYVRRGGRTVTECDDLIIPPSRKVHIVNLAGATNPSSRLETAGLRDYLLTLGWDDSEVVLTERSGMDDFSITPETILQQEGYGIVLFVGHGGLRYDASGQQHLVMQCFRGGSWSDGYQPYVTEARWDQYRQWQGDGDLVRGQAWSSADSTYISDVYMRDELIASQMQLSEGAMVSFVCCNSWQLQDELTELGAGSVLAWDGRVTEDAGFDTWRALLAGLTPDYGARSDAETLAWLQDHGLGYSTSGGVVTPMRLGGDPRAWRLPAEADFYADSDCLPAGTASVEVALRYADCPEADRSFTVAPDALHSLDDLIPAGADVELRVKDAGGNTLGAGIFGVDLDSGWEWVDLCPCEGSASLDLTDFPQDGPYTASRLAVGVAYADATLGPASYDLALPSTTLHNLVPGEATFAVTALAANGDVLGTTTVTATSRCDAAVSVSTCFGWLVLSSTAPPADTAELTATATGHGQALPPSVTFAPGGQAGMYGFAVGEQVTLDVVARNAVGNAVGTTTAVVTVQCGPNEIDLDFAIYGIIIEVSPEFVDADGVETAAITATLRAWLPDDVLQPTGDPVAGKLVQFDTDLGYFVGPDQGTSGADGRVTASLSSTETGVAAVRAFVLADLVESRPAFVNFNAYLRLILDGRSTHYVGDNGNYQTDWIKQTCVTVESWINDWQLDNATVRTYRWQIVDIRFAQPGDTLRIRYAPLGECDFDGPSVTAVWLHIFYGRDYARQITRRLTSGANPLTGVIDVSTVLENPWDPTARRPAPAPERRRTPVMSQRTWED